MSKDVDDLLAGDAPPAKKTKPAAKKAEVAAAPAPAKKAAAKKAEVAAAPAKKAAKVATEKKEKAENGAAATAILKLKSKKPVPYSEIAEKTGLDIRSIRRASRALRDEGKVELVKEGTKVSVKIVAAI